MRLDDYNNNQNSGMSVGYMILGVIFFVVVIVALIFLINTKPEGSEKASIITDTRETTSEESVLEDSTAQTTDVLTEEIQEAAEIPTDELVSGSDLTADDLDFWDMYPEETTENEEDTENKEDSETDNSQDNKSDSNTNWEQNNVKDQVEDPSYGGKYTLIEKSDGTEEWVMVKTYLEKNEYNFDDLVYENSIMKYYEDGELISSLGIDVSKNQGDINFTKVKKAGIDFVMIRVGARGYSSGKIVMDSYFEENLKEATEAGLNVGLYFFSQAITKEEAIEEANLVVNKVAGYSISYPVAFDLEGITGDTARTDGLTKEQRTDIAIAFLNVIQSAGYQPMIYGNKETLIQKFELSTLTGTDVWLSQIKEKPDYPYQFTMWQYSSTGSVSGVTGDVDMNISFIDYELK